MTGRPAGPDHLAVSLANPRAERVKKVAALAGRSARSKAGAMLVEGPQGVREAVRHVAGQVRDVYLSEDAHVRHPELAAEALAAGLYVHLCTPEVVRAMSADAQGVVAVIDAVAASLDDVVAGTPRLVAVLSNVRDPGNAGTAIRVADAAGADAVVLAGESVDLGNPKLVRATAGSLFHLPVVRALPLDDALASLSEAGLQVIAADGSGTVVLGETGADAAALTSPTAWVFGNEAWGLRDEEMALADLVVRVPIFGRAESLNLAAAVAVCLYGSAGAQRASE